MASCVQVNSLLQAYIDDELSGAEKVLLEDHLDVCSACRHDLQSVRAASALLFEALARDSLREDLTPFIMTHLPEMEPQSKPPAFPKKMQDQGDVTVQWARPGLRPRPVFAVALVVIAAAAVWNFRMPVGDAPSPSRPLGIITHRQGGAVTDDTASGQRNPLDIKDTIDYGATLETGEGGVLQVGLSGPSQFTMYANTRVEVVSEREIHIARGRVFMDVAKEARLFRVNTPTGRATVMGTSFHVAVLPEATEVTVISGKVLVENEIAFALLNRGEQASFSTAGKPAVKYQVDARPYLLEARRYRPDQSAERLFLEQIAPDRPLTRLPGEQVFVVETHQRPIGALLVEWVPDPYTDGHSGYNVYVADDDMTPLFKAHLAPETFRDKQLGTKRIPVSNEIRARRVSAFHIILIPDYGSGRIETPFTEVSAVGL